MRVAQTAMVIDAHRAVAIAVLDNEVDRPSSTSSLLDDGSQTIAIECHSVHGNDLRANSEPGLKRRTFPQDIGEFRFASNDESERIGEIGDLSASFRGFEEIRRRVVVD